MDDADLVRACLEDDREAWTELLERHGPYLRRVIAFRLKGRPGSDPEAVFQEFWLGLLEKDGRRLRLYDPARPLLPFLAALVLEQCRIHLRKAGAPAVSRAPEEADPSPGPAEKAERREALALLDRLEPRERLAIALVLERGLDYAQAARVMGVKEGSVGSLLSRAKARLREFSDFPQGGKPGIP